MAFSLKNLAIIVLELNCFRYLSLSSLVWNCNCLGNFHYILPNTKARFKAILWKENFVLFSGWLQQKEKRKIRIFRDFYAYNMTLPRIKVKGFCYKKVLLRRPLKATWNVLLLLLFWPFLQLNPRKNKIYSLEAGNAINCTVQ